MAAVRLSRYIRVKANISKVLHMIVVQSNLSCSQSVIILKTLSIVKLNILNDLETIIYTS